MKKIIFISMLIISLLLSQSMVYADTTNSTTSPVVQPVITTPPISGVDVRILQNGLRGDYYTGNDFSNFDTFRIDNSINFNWGNGKPILGLGIDNFCVRWSGYIVPKYNEVYTFTTKSDDGVRLYINGILLINDWGIHGEKTTKSTIILQAGQPYSIKVEYFEHTGSASVKLYWSSQSQRNEIIPHSSLYTPTIQPTINKGNGTGLKGSYYDGANFNNYKSSKIDKTINFEWKYKATQKHNAFSIRWVGKIQPLFTETYTFKTISDDGIRVLINGQKIIDNWKDNNSAESTGKIQLQAGQLYDIQVDYYENNQGPAVVKLYWSSNSQPLEIVTKSQLYPPVAPPLGTGNGLKAEYYGDSKLSVLKLVKTDTDINFDWGNRGLPVDGVAHNNFSVRWTGKIQPLYSENYTFKTICDDGIRLWINGKIIVDDWNIHSAHATNGKIELQAGQMYDIKIEYFQETGFAKSELYWSSNSQKNIIVPQSQLYSN